MERVPGSFFVQFGVCGNEPVHLTLEHSWCQTTCNAKRSCVIGTNLAGLTIGSIKTMSKTQLFVEAFAKG